MDGADDDDYRRKARLALLAVVVITSMAISALLVAFSYYCYIRNKVSRRLASRKRFDNEEEEGGFDSVQVTTDKGLHVFTFKQLHSATGGFSKSNVVGHGGFGSVYRGVLSNGRKVAVKVMDQEGKQGEEEFEVEVELLSRLRSPYLLALLGYCSGNNRKLLVYDFMANGGLQEHLSNVTYRKLDWETRLRIALEAAKGLEYLHEHVSPPVIHRDFKSSNILLDKSFHAKVSDFGLAKLGPDSVLLTGRVPVDMKRPSGEGVLVSWALPKLTDRDQVVQIMDPALEGQYSMKEVVQVAAIAAMCVQSEADYRPLMADVVQSLVPLVRSTSKLSACSSFHGPKSPLAQDVSRASV
ncbi:Receptor-like cytoplasmic kinase 185 [Linum perenne]